MSISPKRIFHITAQLRLGAGRFIVDTAIEQARGLGHQVAICTSDDADEHWRSEPALVAELKSGPIEVYRIGDFFHRRTDLLQNAARQLDCLIGDRSTIPLVVHAHTAMAAAVGFWTRPDILVSTCHGWGMNRPPEFDLQDSLAYQLCDAVVTYSRYWADRLVSDLAAPRPSLVPMGLNLDRLPKFEQKPVSSAPMRIVTVCELIPRKGVDLLLKAMRTIWVESPEVELHIVGHGESAEALRQFASSIDPAMKRIVFHGAVRNPYSQLALFDIFALASRSDNLPVVLLEAMFAGLPIVATGVGGVPDLISSAGCGLVVTPESESALSDGLIAMLRLGRKSMRRLGLKGERFSRRWYDVRRTTWKLERIYAAAIKNKRHGRRASTRRFEPFRQAASATCAPDFLLKGPNR